MQPGPRPQPTVLQYIRGNPGKRNLTARLAREPNPEPAKIDPPAGLTGAALEKWQEVAPMLAAVGVLTKADVALLARYCELSGLYVEALEDVRRNGLTVDNPSGRKVQNPAVAALRGLHADLLRAECELGLTPSARSGLAVGRVDPEEDSLEQFIQRGKDIRAGRHLEQ